MTSTSPEVGRAGTTYFVPGFRIRKLGVLRAGSEAGVDLPTDVLGDVLKVSVTRVCSGATTYSVTLNNAYTTTAKDRGGQNDHGERFGRREVEGRDRPVLPRYKYNGFQLLRFGERLRIDMRYWPDPPADANTASPSPQTWVPMVAGPITDMKFTFSSSEGARLEVGGEDDLSQLKDRHQGRIEFDHKSEREIVGEVLRESGYPLTTIADSRVEWPSFAEDSSQGISSSLEDGQAYFEYLQRLAEELDFEVFTEFADLGDPDSGVEFHFEPSRSRLPPDGTLRGVFQLGRETNLESFSPTIKVVDQYSSVTVSGRHRDRQRAETVEEEVAPGRLADLSDELHFDPELDEQPRSGPEIRELYFPGRPNRYVRSNETNVDRTRARHRAESALRRKAREFMTISGRTIGLPRLRPGNHIEIRGMRPPFDGFFYVTQTVHSFGNDGLRTEFSARRPGMPEPPYEES